jgi:hypothetical protein
VQHLNPNKHNLKKILQSIKGDRMQLTFLGSGGGRFRDHNSKKDDWRI